MTLLLVRATLQQCLQTGDGWGYSDSSASAGHCIVGLWIREEWSMGANQTLLACENHHTEQSSQTGEKWG